MSSESKSLPFRRAAVLGAGVMGRAIAAHLANAGLDVLLLDIPPRDAPPAPDPNAPAAGDDDARRARNRLALDAIRALPKDKPAPLFAPGLASRLSAGNLEDDLHRLADVDWILEVVVERVDIKRALLSRVAEVCRDSVVLSTNTSGIPVASIAEVLPAGLRRRFLGTHFFNPPRYMHLLEIIPGPDTDPDVVAGVTAFGEETLGKGVVIANDRPNFVANRIGAYGMLRSVELMVEMGLTVEEVDALSGPIIGRPKSATFRTADLVGVDVLLHVAHNVREGAPDDPEIDAFTPHPILQRMVEAERLGSKTGAGFYRKRKTDQGTTIEVLDLDAFDYREKRRARFAEIDALRTIEELPARFKALAKSKGKGADFAWAVLRDTLRYAAAVAPEVAGDIASVDRALRWGFGWEMGPFEIWDALGLARTTQRMAEEGRPAPAWVQAQVDAGAESFYGQEQRDGVWTEHTLSAQGSGTIDLPPRPGVLVLSAKPGGPEEIERNAGASLWDLGDHVLGLEFHSKMNSLGGDAIAMSARATARCEQDFVAMVVGNQGTHFSAGANLALLLLGAMEGEFEEIDLMVRQFQRMTMGLRQCPRPVVVAPFSLALGGGAEVTLHGDAVCASAELYMGLVEAGVGLIPAGGGTKELYLRMLDGLGPDADPRVAARRAFEVIGLAKVSTSAVEARGLGFFQKGDTVVLNPDRLLAAAKAKALGMAGSGYQAPPPRTEIPVGGDDTYALLEVGLYNYIQARQISEHDRLIGRKIAGILSGGAHKSGPSPRVVSEQHLLDLEREAFLSLCGERKTLERVQHMLKTGKPLRN